MKLRHIIVIAISALSIITLISYQGLKSSKSKNQKNDSTYTQDYNSYPSTNPVNIYSTNPSTSPSVPDLAGKGEEVNKQGQRRPAQYLHICDTANGIEYVSQGTPKCLGNDKFISDYDPSVPGTAFSSPCQATSGSTRYVYISNDEQCPSGTKLLFYNTLGGSTSSSTL
jgi:hypothetical protein